RPAARPETRPTPGTRQRIPTAVPAGDRGSPRTAAEGLPIPALTTAAPDRAPVRDPPVTGPRAVPPPRDRRATAQVVPEIRPAVRPAARPAVLMATAPAGLPATAARAQEARPAARE